jgi:hypothetical protein
MNLGFRFQSTQGTNPKKHKFPNPNPPTPPFFSVKTTLPLSQLFDPVGSKTCKHWKFFCGRNGLLVVSLMFRF